MSTEAILPKDSPTPSAASPPSRIASVDTYRGAVMFLMMAEVLELARVARGFPESEAWKALAYHQSHVEWGGCSVHDMIQPSFSFLVGVALPFSLAVPRLAARQSSGAVRDAPCRSGGRSIAGRARHGFLRSIALRTMTNYTFEDTLTQIGLGYLPLFLLPAWRGRSARVQAIALGGDPGRLLAEHSRPIPSPADLRPYPTRRMFPSDWPHLADRIPGRTGTRTAIWPGRFDTLVPQPVSPGKAPFTHNAGGYATLSFIPTLGTMILGLIAGGWLQGQGSPSDRKLARLILAGVVCARP